MQIAGQNLNNQHIVQLPASKSVANRVLILNAVSGKRTKLINISEARDTQTMYRLLNESPEVLDVLDAGTTMRFLTAFHAIGNNEKIITGTQRMQERPIGILVDALNEIGANITYEKIEGYPPLKIKPFNNQLSSDIAVKGNVSSQFISALMMIGPILPKGLTIRLTGKIGSRPYIVMTEKLMRAFGAEINFEENIILIKPGGYSPPKEFIIEPDWSGASYWYSILALSDLEFLKIDRLKIRSYQGDQVIADIMTELGVETNYTSDGALLKKLQPTSSFKFDFSDCPDLAQTVMVVCAAQKIPCEMTGLESLKIKETNRVAAMRTELHKIGATLIENKDVWKVNGASSLPKNAIFHCYDDHRMAMALAPLASRMTVQIDDPDVVNKSFPSYWEEMKNLGFDIKR